MQDSSPCLPAMLFRLKVVSRYIETRTNRLLVFRYMSQAHQQHISLPCILGIVEEDFSKTGPEIWQFQLTSAHGSTRVLWFIV